MKMADTLVSQTSIRSGNIIGMGKGFHCSIYKGHDLGELITQACERAVSSDEPVGSTLLMDERTSTFVLMQSSTIPPPRCSPEPISIPQPA